MNFKNKNIICALGLILLKTNAIVASGGTPEKYGVVVEFDQTVSRAISDIVETSDAVDYAKSQTDDVYFVERNRSQTYHLTLGMFTFYPSNLEKFKGELNLHFSGIQPYVALGYELRMFAHFVDGTHMQYRRGKANRTSKSLEDFMEDAAESGGVKYANLVLKLGVGTEVKGNGNVIEAGKLSRDWRAFEGRLEGGKALKSKFRKYKDHDIEPHVTIATFYKYDRASCQVVGASDREAFVQPKNATARLSSDRCRNESFSPAEAGHLQMMFILTDEKFKLNKSRGMPEQLIGALQITQLENGHIVTRDTVALGVEASSGKSPGISTGAVVGGGGFSKSR